MSQYTEEYDVIIIGNGPNGLALSYMLAGNWPYYMLHQHPDPILNHKLCEEPSKSLVEQDLEYLSEGLEGRSFNPVAILFDQLQRPNTDLGYEQGSCLNWLHDPDHSVNHLVLGYGPPGGSWHRMQGSQLTLSLNNWLELPGFDFQDWLREHKHDSVRKPCALEKSDVAGIGDVYNRATASHVAEYYKDYVEKMNLSKYIQNDSKVLSVKAGHNGLYEIRGVKGNYPNDIEPFKVLAHNVVLATGNNVPKVLGIPGEKQDFVYNHMVDCEELCQEDQVDIQDPCLVVGAGLSAADAVLRLMSLGIPVLHSIRRGVSDYNIIYNNLTPEVYPEYCSIKEMMKGTHPKAVDGSYECLPKSKLVEICNNNVCIFKKSDGTHFKRKVSNVFIMIGSKPELSFFPQADELGFEKNRPVDSKSNPLDINPFTYECQGQHGLYALGPLVGDNFVRFGMGGALGIVNHLFRVDQ